MQLCAEWRQSFHFCMLLYAPTAVSTHGFIYSWSCILVLYLFKLPVLRLNRRRLSCIVDNQCCGQAAVYCQFRRKSLVSWCCSTSVVPLSFNETLNSLTSIHQQPVNLSQRSSHTNGQTVQVFSLTSTNYSCLQDWADMLRPLLQNKIQLTSTYNYKALMVQIWGENKLEKSY